LIVYDEFAAVMRRNEPGGLEVISRPKQVAICLAEYGFAIKK